MAKRKKTSLSGFSLVEMILVVAISAIIAVAAGQIFLSQMKTFDNNKEVQKNVESGRSAIELMSKNIRMSKYATKSGSGNPTVYLYNPSQGRCLSYQFDLSTKALKSAFCNPSFDTSGNPVGECFSSGSCFDGSTVYSSIAENVTGDFYLTSTNRATTPFSIGRATIIITTSPGAEIERTLETSVSFIDYDGILQ